MADLRKLSYLSKYGIPIEGTPYAYGFSYILKANSTDLMFSYASNSYVENSYPEYEAPEIFKSSETEHGDEGFIKANYTNTPGLNDIINKLNDIIFDINLIHYKDQMYMDPELSISKIDQYKDNIYIDLNSDYKYVIIKVKRKSISNLQIKILSNDDTDFTNYFIITIESGNYNSTDASFKITAKNDCPLGKYKIVVSANQQDGTDMYEEDNTSIEENIIRTQIITKPYVIRNIATRALKDDQGNSRDYMFKDGSFTNSGAGEFIYNLSYISENGISYTANNLKFSDIICYTTGNYSLDYAYTLGANYNTTCQDYTSNIIGTLESTLMESAVYLNGANISCIIFNGDKAVEEEKSYKYENTDFITLPNPGLYNDSKMELLFNYYEKDFSSYYEKYNKTLGELANRFCEHTSVKMSLLYKDNDGNLKNTFTFDKRLTYLSQCITLLDDNGNEISNDDKIYNINFKKIDDTDFYDINKKILKFKLEKFTINFDLVYLNIFNDTNINIKNLILKLELFDKTYDASTLKEPEFFYNFEIPINFNFIKQEDWEMFYVTRRTRYDNAYTYNIFDKNSFCPQYSNPQYNNTEYSNWEYDTTNWYGKLIWDKKYSNTKVNIMLFAINQYVENCRNCLHKLMLKNPSNGGSNGPFRQGTDSLKSLVFSSSSKIDLTCTDLNELELIYIYLTSDFDSCLYYSAIYDNEKKKYINYNCIINNFNNTLERGFKNTIIPNTVTSIGKYAFYNLLSLTQINIPDSVTSIGDYAFEYCENLSSVTFENGLTSIGEEAFKDCTSLETVIIPDSVTTINEGAFLRCKSIKSVKLSNNLTKINGETFLYCTSLTSIVIPDSVTSIEGFKLFGGAFMGCSSLTKVTIGNSVTSIGKYAFSDCTSLPSINIPNSVTNIGKEAFYSCSKLTSVTIGNGIKTIGEYAFMSGYLTSVTINATTPPKLNGTVFTSLKTYAIYVPAESVEAYKNAETWEPYKNRIQPIP